MNAIGEAALVHVAALATVTTVGVVLAQNLLEVVMRNVDPAEEKETEEVDLGLDLGLAAIVGIVVVAVRDLKLTDLHIM